MRDYPSTLRRRLAAAIAACALCASCAYDDAEVTLRVATASNFLEAARELALNFETAHGIDVEIVAGSTGALFAQIKNRAPYDVFLAADAARPQRLEAEGLVAGGSRFTYALGRLVLWLPREPEGCDAPGLLRSARRVAVANPDTAPYGRAAFEAIESLGFSAALADRFAFGENVLQAYQFAASGNVDAAFIALAQSRRDDTPGCTWPVPDEHYGRIEQQAVVLVNAASLDEAMRFTAYLKSAAAQDVIRRYGYGTDATG